MGFVNVKFENLLDCLAMTALVLTVAIGFAACGEWFEEMSGQTRGEFKDGKCYFYWDKKEENIDNGDGTTSVRSSGGYVAIYEKE